MKRSKRIRRWHVLLATVFILIVLPLCLNVRLNHHKQRVNAAPAMVVNPQSETPEAPTGKRQQGPTVSETVTALQPVPSPAPAITALSATNGKIYYEHKVAVLTYHHIDPTESSITISPDRFKSHLQALQDNGFHVISMEGFIQFLQKKADVPPNAVVVTFDDGYESVYKYALPLLKAQSMTATVFLIVSYIDDGVAHSPPILKWNEILEMHNSGFSFYSHSYNSHMSIADSKGRDLSPLVTKIHNKNAGRLETDEEYKNRIKTDLSKADDILNARLGNHMNLLCLPHGQYNQTVIDIAHQVGIEYVFTGNYGFNTADSTILKRINAGSPYETKELLIKQLSRGK